MKEERTLTLENNAQTTSALESESQAILEHLENAERELSDYYKNLATMPDPAAKEEIIERELASLRRTSSNLTRANMKVLAASDELSARFRDVKASRRKRRLIPAAPANSSIDLEEENSKHFAKGLNFYKLFLICFVGSFAGVVIELLWCIAKNGYIESRSGLVYGPFNLLYGAGAVALTLALYRFRNHRGWLSFVGAFIVGSVLEYVCSWAQELFLGSRSWDYTGKFLNINGRICLIYSIFWGILGVFWIKNIYPRMAKLILKIPDRVGKIVTWVLVVFMVVNCAVTVVAVARWSQRVDGVPADSAFEEFIDERFPDSRMERIFANMDFGEKESAANPE